MATIQGSPSVIATENPAKAKSALEIALFGAAHVVRETAPETLLGGNVFAGAPSLTYSGAPKLHELRLKAVAEGVRRWFVEQMPQLIFPQRLEDVIQETAERSYDD
jgi:hypothetical protein